jgi:hypothetical protein
MLKRISSLILLSTLLTACSPRSFLDKVIKDKGFIPFELPMPSTRVGTVLRGNNNELYLVAKPETCMPETFEGQALRWIQPTDLPNEYKKVDIGFTAEIVPIFGIGNGVINFKPKVGVNYAKTVSVEFKNPSVEFLDEFAFKSYYQRGANADCKELLKNNAFIGQGLRVEEMKFQFKDKLGASVNLTVNLGYLVDISPGVKWQIENEYTLVISTPKYIGYRMAQLEVIPALKLLYASTIDNKGNWLFHDVDQALLDPALMSGFGMAPRPAERLP